MPKKKSKRPRDSQTHHASASASACDSASASACDSASASASAPANPQPASKRRAAASNPPPLNLECTSSSSAQSISTPSTTIANPPSLRSQPCEWGLQHDLSLNQDALQQEKIALGDNEKGLQDEEKALKNEENNVLSKWELARSAKDDEAAKVWLSLVSAAGARRTSVQGQMKELQGQMKHHEKRLAIKDEQAAHLTREQLASRSDQVIWEEDGDAQRMAAELVSMEAQKLGSGIEVTSLTGFIDADGERSPALITRRHTRLLSQAAVGFLEGSPPQSRAAIIGGLGIGKTRTLLHVLRLLLRKGQYVLYANRTTKVFTKFELECDGKFTATRTQANAEDVLRDFPVYGWVLVDPDKKGNDIFMTNGRLVLATSTHRRHHFHWRKKPYSEFFQMGHWALEELLVAAREMRWTGEEGVNEDTILFRFEIVGGAPRYILDENQFKERKQDILKVGKSLRVADVTRLLVSIPAQEREDRPGILSRQYLTYQAKRDEGKEGEEGEEGRYMEPDVVCISRFAREVVLTQYYYRFFFEIVERMSARESVCLGAEFEDLAFLLVANGGKYMARSMKNKVRRSTVFPRLQMRFVASHAEMDEVLKKVGEGEEMGGAGHLYATPQCFKMVDFVDSSGNLYKATINSRHGVSTAGLADVVGKMCGSGGGRGGWRGRRKVNFYWCVPDTEQYANCRFRLPDDVGAGVREVEVVEHVLFVKPTARLGKAKSEIELSVLHNGSTECTIVKELGGARRG